jgi:hypothetical protein
MNEDKFGRLDPSAPFEKDHEHHAPNHLPLHRLAARAAAPTRDEDASVNFLQTAPFPAPQPFNGQLIHLLTSI